jgi:hypothetical protein
MKLQDVRSLFSAHNVHHAILFHRHMIELAASTVHGMNIIILEVCMLKGT